MSWVAVAVAATAAVTVYNGEKSRRAQNIASDKAEAAAKRQALLADQAANKANAKSPDALALLGANRAYSANGQAGTMLTSGTVGTTLGKTSLLGG